MRVSVITPCYNGGAFLPRCCASVADQGEALAEHIVADGGSTDGTVEWLKRQRNLRWVSEKDRGMYDAINKGFRMAGGDIVAHLNCDEQYLPGTLAAVADVFARHPGVDIVLATWSSCARMDRPWPSGRRTRFDGRTWRPASCTFPPALCFTGGA